jgi:hypothetical protein
MAAHILSLLLLAGGRALLEEVEEEALRQYFRTLFFLRWRQVVAAQVT